MTSSLTLQFRQQQLNNKQDGLSATNLPSPPDSSYEEDNTMFNSSASCPPPSSLPNNLIRPDNMEPSQGTLHARDSLQSHFSTLTLQAITNSLPENYTIDHSSIKASLRQALVTTVAAATAATATATTTVKTQPIPIETNLPNHTIITQLSTTTPAGGLTIRHPPRLLSESPKTQHHYFSNSIPTSSTSLPTLGSHRCSDCGKVYKHPSCLAKHRWEHSSEWELTSKLLLTKHQQVQMLEAAAILVSMDQPKQPLHQLVEQEEEEEVDIDNDDDGDSYVNIDDDDVDIDDDDDDDNDIDDDDDDDDISMDLDDDDDDETMDQAHTFPSMIGSTPAMLPSSFSTHVV